MRMRENDFHYPWKLSLKNLSFNSELIITDETGRYPIHSTNGSMYLIHNVTETYVVVAVAYKIANRYSI